MAQQITTIRLSDPLDSIRDDAHFKEALAAIDVMLDVPDCSEAQETYLSALTDLVETYETAHVVFPPRTGLDALRFLMESNDLKQEGLVPIFGAKSIVWCLDYPDTRGVDRFFSSTGPPPVGTLKKGSLD